MGEPEDARGARRYFGRSRRRSSWRRPDGTGARGRTNRRCRGRGPGHSGSDHRPNGCSASSRTLFQPWIRMSGWWFAASASVGHRVRRTPSPPRSRRAPARARSRRPRGATASPPAPARTSSSVSLSAMRIVSLVPSATEMLFALGLGTDVTAVTHECDHPAAGARAAQGDARRDRPGPAAGGDRPRGARADRAGPGDLRARRGGAAARAARPDRHAGAVRRLRGLLRRRQGGRRSGWTRCPRCSRWTRTRSARCSATSARSRGRPTPRTPASTSSRTPPRGSTACGWPCAPPQPVRVAALEWLDPIYVAGHWTPQMIEYAGGLDVLGMPGEHSERRTWEEVAAARPEVVIVMPCGYDAERAAEEAYEYARRARRAGRPPRRRRRRRRLLLPPRPAAGRRARAARARAAPRPAARGAAGPGRDRALDGELRGGVGDRRRPREAIAIAAHASTAGTGERRRRRDRLDRERGEHAADEAAEVAADRDVEAREERDHAG